MIPRARTAGSAVVGDSGVSVGKAVGRGVGSAGVFFVVTTVVAVSTDPKVGSGSDGGTGYREPDIIDIPAGIGVHAPIVPAGAEIDAVHAAETLNRF